MVHGPFLPPDIHLQISYFIIYNNADTVEDWYVHASVPGSIISSVSLKIGAFTMTGKSNSKVDYIPEFGGLKEAEIPIHIKLSKSPI